MNIRNVVGYDNYIISDNGEVFNKRNINKPLKTRINKHGYKYLNLSKNGIVKSKLIHRIVAEAFLNYQDGDVVNHKDGNKLNNNIDNLEFCTQKDNVKHAFDNGLMHPINGEECPWSKLTDEEVLKIRKEYIPFICSYNMLAKKYNVSKSEIIQIVNNKIRKL